MELSPGELFAGYAIQRVLGQGGMGTVYLARHPRLPRSIALKLLNRNLTRDDVIRTRFLREADNVSRLEHPNIVHVYDRGSEDGQLWISMQYVDGSDAAQLIREQGPPTLERAVRVVSEVAKALDHAHGEGILHRDVKPANILLAKAMHGAQERVLLADFGIAKSLEDTRSLTGTGTLLASLPYAAPEQFDPATDADERTDVYALGCTLYQLLTGVLPYPGTTPMQLLRGHLEAPIPKPGLTLKQRTGQQLPPGLDDVIATALAKSRADRYRTCGELARDARAALVEWTPPTVESPRAQPVPPPEAPEWSWVPGLESPAPLSGAVTIVGPAAGDAGPADNEATVPVPRPRRSRRRIMLVTTAILAVGISIGIVYKVVASTGTGAHSSTGMAAPVQTPPTIPLDVQPRAIAVDPGTHAVYVAASDNSNRVSVLDPGSGRVTATIPVPGNRTGIAVDTATHAIYSAGSDGTDPYIDIIDPGTLKVTATVKVGPPKPDRAFDFPDNLLVDPVTHAVYASNSFDGWLSVLDPGTRAVTTTRGGSFEYAVDPVQHKLVGVNIASNSAFTVDPVSGDATDQTEVKNCCTGPVVFDPATRTLYAVDLSEGKLVVIDLGKRQVVTTIATGKPDLGSGGTAAIDTATHTLYLANGSDRSIAVIDLARNAVSADLAVADSPQALALDPSTRTLYVISETAKTLTIVHPR